MLRRQRLRPRSPSTALVGWHQCRSVGTRADWRADIVRLIIGFCLAHESWDFRALRTSIRMASVLRLVNRFFDAMIESGGRKEVLWDLNEIGFHPPASHLAALRCITIVWHVAKTVSTDVRIAEAGLDFARAFSPLLSLESLEELNVVRSRQLMPQVAAGRMWSYGAREFKRLEHRAADQSYDHDIAFDRIFATVFAGPPDSTTTFCARTTTTGQRSRSLTLNLLADLRLVTRPNGYGGYPPGELALLTTLAATATRLALVPMWDTHVRRSGAKAARCVETVLALTLRYLQLASHVTDLTIQFKRHSTEALTVAQVIAAVPIWSQLQRLVLYRMTLSVDEVVAMIGPSLRDLTISEVQIGPALSGNVSFFSRLRKNGVAAQLIRLVILSSHFVDNALLPDVSDAFWPACAGLRWLGLELHHFPRGWLFHVRRSAYAAEILNIYTLCTTVPESVSGAQISIAGIAAEDHEELRRRLILRVPASSFTFKSSFGKPIEPILT